MRSLRIRFANAFHIEQGISFRREPIKVIDRGMRRWIPDDRTTLEVLTESLVGKMGAIFEGDKAVLPFNSRTRMMNRITIGAIEETLI